MKLSRVFAAVGVLLAAIGIARSVHIVTSLYHMEIDTIENRLEIPAQSMAHVIGEIDANADLALRDLQAASGSDPALASPSLRAIMLDRMHGRTAAQKIEVYDAAGTAILSTLADPPIAVSVAGYDFFKRQMAASSNRLIVSDLVTDPIDGQPKIVESRPILDGAGSARGVIAVYLDAETIQKLFDSLPLPPGSSLALFNADGRFLVGTPLKTRAAALGVDYSQRAVFQAFRNGGPEGSFRKFTTMVGQEQFVAGVGGPNSNFVVTASWDVATALAHCRSMAATVIGGTSVAIVIVGALFGYLVLQLRRNEALLNTLGDSEAKFRDLMTALPDAVLLVDRSLIIVFANPAAEKLYGYGPGEMHGLTMGRIMPDAMRSGDEQGVRAALTCAEPPSGVRAIERSVRRKDGSELPVEINACPYRAPEGPMLVIAIRDISQRMANDLALQRSRESLARAQRIAEIGNFDRDMVTGKTEWSDEFVRIWGIEDAPAHATAEYLVTLVHPEDRQKFIEGRDLALQRKPVPPLDFKITRPDGEKRILHREYGVVFDEKGKPLRMFGTVQDQAVWKPHR